MKERMGRRRVWLAAAPRGAFGPLRHGRRGDEAPAGFRRASPRLPRLRRTMTLPERLARGRPADAGAPLGSRRRDRPRRPACHLRRQRDRPLVLASTTKLFTTAAALDRLGPGYRFRTTLLPEGEIGPDGTLPGRLVVARRGRPGHLRAPLRRRPAGRLPAVVGGRSPSRDPGREGRARSRHVVLRRRPGRTRTGPPAQEQRW